jgi:hypothetical protein
VFVYVKGNCLLTGNNINYRNTRKAFGPRTDELRSSEPCNKGSFVICTVHLSSIARKVNTGDLDEPDILIG